MKILYLTGELSYPFNGGAMHYTSIIEYMSQYNECDLLTFARSLEKDKVSIISMVSEKLPNTNLLGLFFKNTGITLKIKKILNLISFMPQGLSHWDNNDFQIQLSKVLDEKQYDVIHLIHFPAVAQYLPYCRNIPTVITLGDSFSLTCTQQSNKTENISERILLKIASYFYRNAENKYLPFATKSHVVSEEDKKYLQKLSSEIDVEHIPVNTSKEFESYDLSKKHLKIDHSIILLRPFGTGFSWFISDVYPILIDAIPNLKITILSQEINNDMAVKISKINNINHVRWVQDFAQEVLKHNVVVLTDPFGTGMATRVIHSMVLGMPVVGTSTAFRGVTFENGKECFIENDISKFADTIISLLLDEKTAYVVGQEARKAVLSQHSCEIIMSKIYNLYNDAIKSF